MTDTQDTNLPKMEGELEDVKQTAEITAEVQAEVQEPAVDEAVAELKDEALETAALEESARKLTKSEILVRMKEIAEDITKVSKAEIDTLKQHFYRLHNSEAEAAKRAFIETGGKGHTRHYIEALCEGMDNEIVRAAVKGERDGQLECVRRD